MSEAASTFETRTPARLDRLPWSRFHTLVVFALGITWILDGLEVTLVGSLSPVLTSSNGLSLSATQIGLLGSAYIAGAVLGALVFGRLTDSWGRKRLFSLTVAIYLLATIASGCSWDFWSFALFRFITGAGIGGEYSAVNSAIQELRASAAARPCRSRHQRKLLGWRRRLAASARSSCSTLRCCHKHGAGGSPSLSAGCLAAVILYVRRFIPESPRWLMTHGRPEEAEAHCRKHRGRRPPRAWRRPHGGRFAGAYA